MLNQKMHLLSRTSYNQCMGRGKRKIGEDIVTARRSKKQTDTQDLIQVGQAIWQRNDIWAQLRHSATLALRADLVDVWAEDYVKQLPLNLLRENRGPYRGLRL